MAESDPAKLKAAATYNAAARDYDLGFWNRFGRTTVERLDLEHGARVLDIACGTGAAAIPAAEAVGPNGSVIAVDLAQNMLDLARQKAASRSLRNVEFRVGDMTALRYPDRHFDAVICVFGVFFAADMESLVADLWRMLKLAGKLAITTWGPRLFEPLYGRWNQAVRTERPDLYAAFHPWARITDPEAVRALFERAGIAAVDVVPVIGRQPLTEAEDWWNMVRGSGLRWTIDQLGETAAQRVRQDNIVWAREHAVDSVETNVIYAVATKPAE